MKTYNIIVIGGGASGMIAAITAARQNKFTGQDVLILEKNKILGRKILVTGNGRCNLTNTNISPDKYFGENTKCLHNIFTRFSSADSISFFEEIGARIKIEEQGRVFPITNQASTVVDLLTEEISRLDIGIKLEEKVMALSHIGNLWEIKTDKAVYRAQSVILTTGSKSYPQVGTTGDGYELCRSLGHTIIETRPALVPLELEGQWFHKLQGVKSDVELVLTNQSKVIARETGELLFTHYGISGPIVLNLSRLIMDYCLGPDTSLAINFFPGYDRDKLAKLFLGRWSNLGGQKTLLNSLIGLLPKKLCGVLIGELKMSPEIKVAQISKKETYFMAESLCKWTLRVRRPRPFTESMVTAGGVATNEINTRTMESLKAKGLYLAGEILDIDGVSGGYNLQFAWSTGYLAGLSATEKRL